MLGVFAGALMANLPTHAAAQGPDESAEEKARAAQLSETRDGQERYAEATASLDTSLLRSQKSFTELIAQLDDGARLGVESAKTFGPPLLVLVMALASYWVFSSVADEAELALQLVTTVSALRDARMRAHREATMAEQNRRQARRLSIHRGLVQHNKAPLRPRLPLPNQL